ncbi:MAG TPA: lipoprotein [Sporosarcina psychrophila]|uniref:Lipoprotein n=1 Tax=Sporosarcina psychrophila TaxID=1476 RepID=A0A921KGH2_SPOPS|nr:lipoprotein [Sporosarcina psychrophila]
MKKRLLLIGIILVVTGCSSSFTFSEINAESVNNNVQEFISNIEVENGIYLYLDGKKAAYIFLNGIYVAQGSDAIYFSDFNVNSQRDTLNIFFNQEYDSDYSNANLNYQVLYEIKTGKVYDSINIFCNGKPTSFDIIAGN